MKSATHRTVPGTQHTALGSMSESPYCISMNLICHIKFNITEPSVYCCIGQTVNLKLSDRKCKGKDGFVPQHHTLKHAEIEETLHSLNIIQR
jgi:hypothetical protein